MLEALFNPGLSGKNVTLTTIAGSSNDRLWSSMENIGWMKETTLKTKWFEFYKFRRIRKFMKRTKIFILTDPGKVDIQTLLRIA
jgi:hypothetical protein